MGRKVSARTDAVHFSSITMHRHTLCLQRCPNINKSSTTISADIRRFPYQSGNLYSLTGYSRRCRYCRVSVQRTIFFSAWDIFSVRVQWQWRVIRWPSFIRSLSLSLRYASTISIFTFFRRIFNSYHKISCVSTTKTHTKMCICAPYEYAILFWSSPVRFVCAEISLVVIWTAIRCCCYTE